MQLLVTGHLGSKTFHWQMALPRLQNHSATKIVIPRYLPTTYLIKQTVEHSTPAYIYLLFKYIFEHSIPSPTYYLSTYLNIAHYHLPTTFLSIYLNIAHYHLPTTYVHI